MTIIIAATIITLGIASWFLLKGQKEDPSQLRMARPQIATLGVQIVCGNCSGDSVIAHKTFLDQSGNCHQCGGHSYLLASTLALNMLQLRAQHQMAATIPGRVIPFGAARSVRTEKIAV